ILVPPAPREDLECPRRNPPASRVRRPPWSRPTRPRWKSSTPAPAPPRPSAGPPPTCAAGRWASCWPRRRWRSCGRCGPPAGGRAGAGWAPAAAAGRELTLEFRFRRPDGQARHVIGRTAALRDGAGRLTGHVGTVTDITARTTAERELRESRRFVQQVTDTNP